MCLFHKWSKYTKPIDTSSGMYLAQFKNCTKCGKVKVRYIDMSAYSTLASVKAETVNKVISYE